MGSMDRPAQRRAGASTGPIRPGLDGDAPMTLRQRLANALNAQKSTGPKDTSVTRYNALRHGMAAETLVLPDEQPEAIARRAAEWNSAQKPFDAYELWLVEVMAV